MDWLDDLLEVHLPTGLVYCFSCSDCSTKPESSNLFSVCWLFTGKYLFVVSLEPFSCIAQVML